MTSLSEARQELARALKGGSSVKMGCMMGLSCARSVVRELQATDLFEGIDVVQAGLDAASCKWCNVHGLWFGGILGCPVCRNFFVE